MATHTDTAKLTTYNPNSYPTINSEPSIFITRELNKIAISIGNIVAVMKLLEARMNSNGLS